MKTFKARSGFTFEVIFSTHEIGRINYILQIFVPFGFFLIKKREKEKERGKQRETESYSRRDRVRERVGRERE